MSEIETETAESVARVLSTVLENEGDSDHERTLLDALDRLWELHGTPMNVDTDNLSEEDVEVTFNFIEDYAPSDDELGRYRRNNDGSHPDRVFEYAFTFVDTEARYVNGCLPSFRDWTVEYLDSNENVLETRSYDHDDEIPTEPVIDGTRYECAHTIRGNDGDVQVYVSPNPVRTDVDVVVRAMGDDYVNIEAHNGPNVSSNKEPTTTLEQNFDWGMLGETEIIVNGDPDDVMEFMQDEQGWVVEVE